MKVIDNFLSPYHFKELQSFLMSDHFPWYYNESSSYKGDGFAQLVHNVCSRECGITSSFYSLFDNCQIKLGVRSLYRIKANLNPRTLFHRNTGWHTDLPLYNPPKTAVLYINTSNGYTKFKKGGKVKSVSNRVVIFDSSLKHAGFTCTDQQRRVVINFNYE